MQMWGGDDPNSNTGQSLRLPGYDNNPSDMKSLLPSPIQLPDLSNIDLQQMPMVGQQQQATMSFANELTNRCGISYFSGLVASGFYGAFRGWRLTHSQGIPMRLRFNSLLNHAMKLGAHNGNMFAILSMYFVCSKRTLPKLSPIDIPSGGILVLSGASAGILYKSMHPPAMIAKWGMVGAALPSVYVLLEYLQDEGIL